MKKKIDIEKLVQWAVRDELPKGRAVFTDIGSIVIRPPPRAGSIGASLARPRGDVDAFGFVPGAPHEDALIVSDAIRDLDTSARFDCLDEALALFGDLAAIAADAAASIMQASFDPRSLVICKAAQSMRPDWEFRHPIPRQMWTQFRDSAGALRERPLVHGDDADGDTIAIVPKRTARSRGVYDLDASPRSPLNWCEPALITIGHARAEYVAWFGALMTLARDLAGKLKEFAPMPSALMPAPWISGQTPASRVLDDGLPPGILTVKLTLAPKRRAPGKPIKSKIEAQMREGRAAWAADKRRRKLAATAESAQDRPARRTPTFS